MSPVQAVPGGVRLTLHIQPRASKSGVAGPHGDAVKIRVAAPPVDGAANAELARFLAETLGVTRAQVQLISGDSGRRKVVKVAGISVREAAARLGLSG